MNSSASHQIPQWSTRQVVIGTLFVASILALFFLIYRFYGAIIIFFMAIVLSIAIRPVVNWLNLHGLPRPAGVIAIYILGFSLLVILAVAVVPLLVEQIAEISNDIPAYYGNLRGDLIQSRSRVLQGIAINLPPEFNLPLPSSGGEAAEPSPPPAQPVPQPLPYAYRIARGVLALVAVFVLGFYWTLESERSIRNALLWLPRERRELVREFINDVEDKVGRFIFGQGILCLIIGVMALIAYMLIGLPYALSLAILAGIYGSSSYHRTLPRRYPRDAGGAIDRSDQGVVGHRRYANHPGT